MDKLEMYLVNIWCKLDDTYCALNKLVLSAELEDNDLVDKLRFRARCMAIEVDNKRDIIMHELGYNELAKTVRLEQGNIRYALGYTDIDKFNEFMNKELGR